MLKLNMRRVVSLLLALCMVTLPFCADIAFAVEDSGNTPAVGDSNLTATLYNTGDDTGTGVSLTADGLVSSEDSTRLSHRIPLGANLLEIRWVFSRNQAHTLKITVPMGMYIIENSWTLPNQQGSYLTDVNFAPLDLDTETDGLQQGTGTHESRYTNAKTGTLTYTTFYDANATTNKDETIRLMVAIDQQLWDKNYSLTTAKPVNGSANAIEIVQDNDGTRRILSDVWTDEQAPAGFNGVSSASTGSTLISPSALPQTPLNFILSTSKSEARDWAYERVDVTYAVTYTVEGKTHTVPVTDVILPSGAKRYNTEYDSVAQTFTIYNYSCKSTAQPSFGMPSFTVTKEMGIPNNTRINVTADIVFTGYNGSVRTADRTASLTFKDGGWALEFISENMVIAPDEWYGSHTEIVDVIGAISFRNTGTDTTDDLIVEVLFDKDYNGGEPKLLVSVYRLPLMSKKTASVTIDYAQEIDGVWQKGQTVMEIKNVTSYDTHGAMVSLGKDKYITKISYNMGGLPGGTYLYRSGSYVRDESGGSIHGRIKGNPETPVTTQMTVFKDNGELIGTKSCTTTVAELENVEYVGYFDPTDDVSTEAGSDTSLNLTLSAYDFGFSQSTFVPSPVIFFVAPKGVLVSGASFSRKINAAKTSVDSKDIVSWDLPNGDVIYRISLGDGASFGGFFVPSANATKIGFEENKFTYVDLALKLDANMSMSYYGLRDRLYLTTAIPTMNPVQFSGFGQWRDNQGGVVKKYHIEYNYAVEEGGQETTRHFASFELGVDPQLRISPLTNGITYTPAITEAGSNNWQIGTSASSALKLYPGEAFQYRITAENNSGSAVPQQNTALYIPVPHKDGKLPDDMGGAQIGNLEVRLTGPVAVSGETAAAWDIRYSIDAAAETFSNGEASFDNKGGAYATWYTADEIANNANLHWEDVICIKAGISENYSNAEGFCAYPIGATDTILATMEMMAGEVGRTIAYASAVWNQYDSAGDEVDGGVLNNTLFAKIALEQGTKDYTGDTLVREQIAVKTYENAGKTSFNEMLNFAAVNFSITKVEVLNLTLKESSFFSSPVNLPVTDKDRTFGITMQLNNNAIVDLASFNGTAIPLGNSYDYGLNTINLQLSHCDTIIDATSERYVDVTLEDEYESIKLIYRIDIFRELLIGPPTTSIVEGAYYNGTGGENSSPTISQDGIVTSQFVFSGYTPSNDYVSPSVILDYTGLNSAVTNLGDNKIDLLLIDMSKKSKDENYVPKYYYYQTTSDTPGTTLTISLDDFKSMENDADRAYEKPSGADVYTLNFVLIVDFYDRNNVGYKDLTNYGAIKIRMDPGNKAQNNDQSSLSVNIEKGRHHYGGSIAAGGSATLQNDQFTFTLNLTLANYDSAKRDRLANCQLWSSRREVLKITVKNQTGNVFPKGSYLTDEEGKVYTPGPDRTYILIPIANVTKARSMTLTFHSPYEKITTGGTLTVGCMSSSPYLQSFQTVGGWTNDSPQITYSVPNDPIHALRVDGDSHLITKDDTKVAFTVSRSDGATDLFWAAYVKEEGGYVETEYSGSETVANNGTFTLDAGPKKPDVAGWTPGTYRVVFTTGGAKSYYSLIVSDENGNFVKN